LDLLFLLSGFILQFKVLTKEANYLEKISNNKIAKLRMKNHILLTISIIALSIF